MTEEMDGKLVPITTLKGRGGGGGREKHNRTLRL